MARSKLKEAPPSRSLDALVEFFDTHDMGDLWEEMPAAHFDIDIQGGPCPPSLPVGFFAPG